MDILRWRDTGLGVHVVAEATEAAADGADQHNRSATGETSQ